MTNAGPTELLFLALGAAAMASMFNKEYRSAVRYARDTELAETPTGTIAQAVTIGLKIKIVSFFTTVDNPTLDRYRRFRKAINLLLLLTFFNVILAMVMLTGIYMALTQPSAESYLRPIDQTLFGIFSAIIIGALFISDTDKDELTYKQPNSVSNGGVRKHRSFLGRARDILQRQGSSVSKPVISEGPHRVLHVHGHSTAELSPSDQALVAAARLSATNAAGTQQDVGHKLDQNVDPETAKKRLIAAGILDNSGELRDEYKRS